jgi:uncharacterized membrane protein YczE
MSRTLRTLNPPLGGLGQVKTCLTYSLFAIAAVWGAEVLLGNAFYACIAGFAMFLVSVLWVQSHVMEWQSTRSASTSHHRRHSA